MHSLSVVAVDITEIIIVSQIFYWFSMQKSEQTWLYAALYRQASLPDHVCLAITLRQHVACRTQQSWSSVPLWKTVSSNIRTQHTHMVARHLKQVGIFLQHMLSHNVCHNWLNDDWARKGECKFWVAFVVPLSNGLSSWNYFMKKLIW